MDRIDLTGKWTLRLNSPILGAVSVPCTIPGDSHSALLEAGLIPNPYEEDHELGIQFLSREDISLEREFFIEERHLNNKTFPYLYVESVDTVAEVFLNNRPLAYTNNMFYPLIVDVSGKLRVGTNTLTIQFHSAGIAAADRAEQLHYPVPHSIYPVQSLHRNQIRTVQCHSGWDWGPCLMVSGIYGSCYLGFATPGRIDTISVRALEKSNQY